MTRRRRLLGVAIGLALAGCGHKPAPTPAPRPMSMGERLKPYVPASRPVDPVTDALPTAPRDASPSVPLRYTVELWEILLPRDSVSLDDAFWKRVDERPGPDTQQLQKNGIRTGELPYGDIETVRKLIEDRGGKHTTYNGVAGKLVEIPVREDVPEQLVFYRNRDDELIGRSWERCDNFLYFSFETTPRNPDRVRISLTPAVRAKEKKMQYALVAGKADRELKVVVEQSNYDATVSADLALDRLMIIAPSAEARERHTLGGTFLIESTPSLEQERLILVIPHAFTSAEPQ